MILAACGDCSWSTCNDSTDRKENKRLQSRCVRIAKWCMLSRGPRRLLCSTCWGLLRGSLCLWMLRPQSLEGAFQSMEDGKQCKMPSSFIFLCFLCFAQKVTCHKNDVPPPMSHGGANWGGNKVHFQFSLLQSQSCAQKKNCCQCSRIAVCQSDASTCFYGTLILASEDFFFLYLRNILS